MLRSDAVAETPAGHGKTLGEAVNDDGALGHSGERPRGEIFAAEEDAGIDFVTQQPKIVLYGEVGEAVQRFFVENGASGIVGRIENQKAGLGCDFGSDFVQVRLEIVFFRQRKWNCLCTEAAREGRIDWKAWIGIENFVPRLDKGHHRERESHFAPGGNEYFFGPNVNAPSSL